MAEEPRERQGGADDVHDAASHDAAGAGSTGNTTAAVESDFSFAVNYPRDRGWTFLLKGGLLVLSGIFILPIFALYGYLMRIVAAAANDEDLPPLTGWGDLFMDGLRLFVVMLPVIVVSYAISFGPVLIAGPESTFGTAWLWISNLISLVVGYVTLAIFATYAVTRDWHRAYDYHHITSLITQGAYLKYYVLYFLLTIVLGVVGSILMVLSLITIVGWIVIIPAIVFYISVATMAFWGRAYGTLTQ